MSARYQDVTFDAEPFRDLIAEFIAAAAVDPNYSVAMSHTANIILRKRAMIAEQMREKYGEGYEHG